MSVFVRSLVAIWLCWLATPLLHAEDTTERRLADFFKAKTRPVLIESCYACHDSHETAEGEFALDHLHVLLRGGGQRSDGGARQTRGSVETAQLLERYAHNFKSSLAILATIGYYLPLPGTWLLRT
ncbi:hypothetical protein DTL42_01540 [Bremerella cremea]|uniref:Cytochrome C Planctomycete-type domain-containing protein n=1 Tax=Bremerella cremea TaxID=1031537 RepID=A0A368KW53_9BACT|nr:hypothetical protein DTL42_01540 [Bremerella cremea]